MVRKSVFIYSLFMMIMGLPIISTAMESPSSMESDWKDGTTEFQKSDQCAAGFLINPYIRVTPETYAAQYPIRKLVLGGGHVYHPKTVLPEDFQPGNGSGLRESSQGGYDYHQNVGWYTVSAEVTDSFGSDWCGDLTNPKHQASLARDGFWDIIWDDSGHVNVFEAEGLLEKIPTWLRPGGVYIIGIPGYTRRPDEERPSVARQIVDLYEKTGPDLSPELTDYVVRVLKETGFSHVEVKPAADLMALNHLRGERPLKEFLDFIDGEAKKSEEIEVILELKRQHKTLMSQYAQEAAKIDPVFGEATLGGVYIVARR